MRKSKTAAETVEKKFIQKTFRSKLRFIDSNKKTHTHTACKLCGKKTRAKVNINTSNLIEGNF